MSRRVGGIEINREERVKYQVEKYPLKKKSTHNSRNFLNVLPKTLG